MLAQSKINLYLCTRNESTPWDYVFKGGQLQDIIKASKTLCSWLFGTWKILKHPRHCSILMSSGYVYPFAVPF